MVISHTYGLSSSLKPQENICAPAPLHTSVREQEAARREGLAGARQGIKAHPSSVGTATALPATWPLHSRVRPAQAGGRGPCKRGRGR